jgi:hypothetical protein
MQKILVLLLGSLAVMLLVKGIGLGVSFSVAASTASQQTHHKFDRYGLK